jgi:hypothetical protein
MKRIICIFACILFVVQSIRAFEPPTVLDDDMTILMYYEFNVANVANDYPLPNYVDREAAVMTVFSVVGLMSGGLLVEGFGGLLEVVMLAIEETARGGVGSAVMISSLGGVGSLQFIDNPFVKN